ncbi:DUF6979 family protein [Neisseria weixii]|nr:hypothetical protein [Neisseria weixii]
MTTYEEMTLKAIELLPETESYESAWLNAARICNKSVSVQKKGCPENAFPGLAESGLIKNVPAKFSHQPQSRNAQYAIKAVKLLKQKPCLAENKKRLWNAVIEESKEHNGRMGVVLALWNKGLII